MNRHEITVVREQSVDGGFVRVNNNVHFVFLALASVQPLCRQRVRVLWFAEQRAAERLESGRDLSDAMPHWATRARCLTADRLTDHHSVAINPLEISIAGPIQPQNRRKTSQFCRSGHPIPVHRVRSAGKSHCNLLGEVRRVDNLPRIHTA